MGRMQELKQMRESGILTVLSILLDRREPVSRAELSSMTDLSLMTIGKIADTLVENGICVQNKDTSGKAGRSAGMLDVNPDLYVPVITLGEKYGMYIISSMMEITDSYTFDDVTEEALKETCESSLFDKHDIFSAVSMVYVVPDSDKKESFENIMKSSENVLPYKVLTSAECFPENCLFVEVRGNFVAALYNGLKFSLSGFTDGNGVKLKDKKETITYSDICSISNSVLEVFMTDKMYVSCDYLGTCKKTKYCQPVYTSDESVLIAAAKKAICDFALETINEK